MKIGIGICDKKSSRQTPWNASETVITKKCLVAIATKAAMREKAPKEEVDDRTDTS